MSKKQSPSVSTQTKNPRRPPHDLNRYVAVLDEQRNHCSRFAGPIAGADRLPLADVIDAVIDYGVTAAPECQHFDCPDQQIVARLSWQWAMADALRDHQHSSPDATARASLVVAALLHCYPSMDLGMESTLLSLSREFRDQLRLAHFLTLEPILLPLVARPLSDIHAEIYFENLRNSRWWLQAAINDELTPGKLKNRIREHLGLPLAGRPKKT